MKWTKDKVKEEVLRIYNLLGGFPKYTDLKAYSIVGIDRAICKHFNGLKNLSTIMSLPRKLKPDRTNFKLKWTKEKVINEFTRVYNLLGKIPTFPELDKYSICGIKGAIQKHFKNLGNLADELHLPMVKNKQWTLSDIESEIVKITELIGKTPTWIDLDKYGVRGLKSASQKRRKDVKHLICPGNKLAYAINLTESYPELAKQWHPTLNDDLKPNMVNSSSKIKVWWLCDCGHIWDTQIRYRAFRNADCPHCSKQPVSIENCLATVSPILAKEWHPTKNGNLTPYNLFAKCAYDAWWLGGCGHEWQATLNSRVSNGNKCPYCSNQKVCLENCLATLRSDIAAEWHPIKNGTITPYDVVLKSNRKKWWLGSCGHEWEARIVSRTSTKNTGCPFCQRIESKGEKKITSILTKLCLKFERQYSIAECKNQHVLPFDFAIFNDNLSLIEYQGEQHYKPVEWFGGEEKYKKVKLRDKIKFNFCKNNNISLLIIPYWESENIEKIVIEFAMS